jgi:DNA-binding transcriptional LysR family regulator
MNSSVEPNWDWYRSFLGVLEHGSLSGAARALGLTQPTMGRHIDALERSLGLKLFTRSFDGFAATEAALELKPYAAGLGATAAALRRVADSHGGGVRGTVRITASEIVGVEVLPPFLVDLRRTYPELIFEVMLSDQVNDLLHREADIAVRMVPPAQDALVARRIGGIEVGLYARAEYLARHGTPKAIEALVDHTLIGFDQENDLIRRFQKQFPMISRARLAYRADSNLAQLAAVRAGFGIGFCQYAIAQRDTRLVRVLPRKFSFMLDTWLAMHEDLRGSPRCAVTFAALADGFAAYSKGR